MPQLDRTDYSINKLISMYSEGTIAIPEIQRDFVWDSKRIKSLLDSVYKDYPSGAIILWRPAFKNRSEFEMLIRPERQHLYKDKLPKYLLLDGQQRLTALCSAILPAEEVVEAIGEEINLPKLFINIKKQSVQVRKDHNASSKDEVLINRVLSRETETSGLTSVLNEMNSRGDILSKHKNGLRNYKDRILEYQYPVQILEDHDYETVAEIFKLVNSQGKVLVAAELELATIVPHWKGFSKHLRIFIREMKKAGFIIDLPFCLKCLAFVATDWPAIDYFSELVTSENDTKKLRIPELETAWKKTKNAIKKLHKILDAKLIDRYELITTRNALVPIVYALTRDRKNKLDESVLVKFLIYSMIGGHYAQRTEAVLRKDSDPLVHSKSIEIGFLKLYKRMVKQHLYSTTFDDKKFAGSILRSPYLLATYLSLRHMKAKDFNKSKDIPISEIEKYHWHHIFPVDYMMNDPEVEKNYRKKKKLERFELRERVNDIANITFISVIANEEIKKRAPREYLEKYCSSDNLKAHCIPKDPELWKPENYDKFCKERRRLLARAMNSYMKSL
jgi:hypothetical protein